ncbi:MAG: hypothetical protein ACLR8P_11460 [Clostridium fessum]
MKQGLTEVLEKQGFPIPFVPRGTDATVPSLKKRFIGQRHVGGEWRHCRFRQLLTAEAAEIVGGSSVYGKYIFRAIRRRDDAVPAGSA